jgi:site-specific recombinase XerD
MKKSLGIRNWEATQKIVRDWEARIDGGSQSVVSAFGYFMADSAARHLKPETIAKYRLLQREMVALFGTRTVDALGLQDIGPYRESWKLSAISARKKIERMRTFFKFCEQRKWSDENPAVFLKPPRAVFSPTLPFSSEEIEKIRDALEVYPDRPKGRREQVKAFVLLLLHSGLRIRDAVMLTQDKIAGGNLRLYTSKTGQAVSLPLPEEAITALEAMKFMPFWSGVGLQKSVVADWQRTLARLFAIAGVKGYAHQFRTTLAVRLLTWAASLEDVAAILGNSAKVCEKHYAPRVQVRQERLFLPPCGADGMKPSDPPARIGSGDQADVGDFKALNTFAAVRRAWRSA